MSGSHYKLNKTVPNPQGGEYRELNDAEMDANIETASDIMAAAMRRIIPLLLVGNQGSVKGVCASIATLSAHELHKFMHANRHPEQEPTLAIYKHMAGCMMAQIDSMETVALMTSLGFSKETIVNGDVHVIKI